MATRSPGRAPDRSTGSRPSNEPSAVTATVMSRALVTSPPSRLAPAAWLSFKRPSAKSSTQPNGKVGRCREPDQQASCPGANRFDIGDIDCDRLAPDIAGLGPVAPEVDALDQHVHRRRHDISDAEHGGIVPWANAYVRRQRQPFGDCGNEWKLPNHLPASRCG